MPEAIYQDKKGNDQNNGNKFKKDVIKNNSGKLDLFTKFDTCLGITSVCQQMMTTKIQQLQ